MTLKTRLGVMIALLLLLSVSVGLLGLYGMNESNAGLKTVYEDRTISLDQISRIDGLLVRSRLRLADALIDPEATRIKAETEVIERNVADINKAWDSYMATYLTPDERKLAEKFAADRARMLKDGLLPAVAAMNEGKLEIALQMQEQIKQLSLPVTAGIEALRKLQIDVAREEYDKASAHYLSLRGTVIAVIVLGVAGAALYGFFMVRTIYRQLGGEPEYAAHIVHSIAANDLSIPVTTRTDDKHSLLFAMRLMQENLARTVGEIRQSADTIATASSQIAVGNLDLSSRTEQQASSLEETASSMEELTTTVKQNGDNARQANVLAMSASDVAVKGGAVVSKVVDTMGSINESANKIVDIIGVIDGIAFQTNILALNAAVEAARAGEQGRGFAVVAAEVRNLAQRSASAAKEIKALIGDSVEKVEAGSKLVNLAGVTMDEIVASVRRVTDIMAEIAAAGREQELGIEQINQAINEMDMVTQQNAALVEEAAGAAQSMQDQAGNMARVVSVFKLDGMQAAAAPPSADRHVAAPVRLSGKTRRAKPVPVRSAPAVRKIANARSGANGDWEEF